MTNTSALVMLPTSGTVYAFDGKYLRAVPNIETFDSFGFSFENVKKLKSNVLMMIPFGSQLRDVTKSGNKK